MNTPDNTGPIRTPAHASGGISKSLLTPCRRIGLSRKIRTPSGGYSSPINEGKAVLNHSAKPNEVKGDVNEDHLCTDNTTPSNQHMKRKSDILDNESNDEEIITNKTMNIGSIKDYTNTKKSRKENNRKKKLGSKISKKLIEDSDSDQENKSHDTKLRNPKKSYIEDSNSEEEDCGSLDVSGCTFNKDLESEKCSEKQLKVEHTETLNTRTYNEVYENEQTKTDSMKSDKKSYKIKTNKNTHKTKEKVCKIDEGTSKPSYTLTSNVKFCKTAVDPTVKDFDFSQDTNTISPKQLHQSKLKISEGQVNANDCDESTGETKLDSKKNLKIVINKNSIDDYIKKKERQKTKENPKLKRKLSTKKSSSQPESISSDDEFLIKKVNLAKKEGRDEKSKVIRKIIQLEKTVKDKETRLETFRNAKKYHKLHNTDELEKVTKIWKTGCETALQDLLVKLREHANIDMQTLLLNLRAPPDLIKYNSDIDCFM